jgi:hypothetical protein
MFCVYSCIKRCSLLISLSSGGWKKVSMARSKSKGSKTKNRIVKINGLYELIKLSVMFSAKITYVVSRFLY